MKLFGTKEQRDFGKHKLGTILLIFDRGISMMLRRYSRRADARVTTSAPYAVCMIYAAMHATHAWSADTWSVHRHVDGGSMQISLDGKPFATYWYRDAEVSRPYFANIFAPSGTKITRNHPPRKGDSPDHLNLHTGIWLAFSNLSGADSWRLKAPIEHVRFVDEPKAKDDRLSFSIENRYMSLDGQKELCREKCAYAFQKLRDGVLILWDSTFTSDKDNFSFGDEEELGLGVRMATPIAVNSGLGGRILNSAGHKNEKEAWSKQADWCDYSGTIGNEYVGITLMPHPKNFRQSWCHCRDNGFMCLNPFGRKAFTGGEPSSVVVPAGEKFALRYGVMIHWNDDSSDFDPAEAYRHYLSLVGE